MTGASINSSFAAVVANLAGWTGDEGTATDRRDADRFPIEQQVRYRVIGKRDAVTTEGIGRTVNISSNGVLFTASEDSALAAGKRVELHIDWPAQLDNRCNLRLVARGRVIRVEEGRAAIEIHQYEFRTAGRAA